MSRDLNIDLSPTRHLLMKDGGDGIEDVDWNAYVAAGGSDVKITRAIRGKLSS